jgi:signal transduction histidine kinase
MLDDMGLVAAIGWQAKDFQKRTGIRCRVKLPPETVKLDIDVSTTAFRIFQEILTNVARHSRATRVDIELDVSETEVRLQVQDNGVGIAESDLNGRKSLGLLGMHERALLFGGEVSITGAPGTELAWPSSFQRETGHRTGNKGRHHESDHRGRPSRSPPRDCGRCWQSNPT